MFIFPRFLSLMFFGQIWSHNMDFFKLTEISLRGTLLYVYQDSNIYFFKIFVSHIFVDKFGFKIWSFLNWLKFRTLLYRYYDFNVYFIFFNCCHSYNFGQIWSQNQMFSKLTQIATDVHRYIFISNLIFIFSKYLWFT